MIKVEYVSHMGTDLTTVNAARISHGKEGDASEEMSERDIHLIEYLARHKHMTPFEHQVLTVIVHCPLYIRSQIHRHRTFSYNEVSRRYSSDDIDFYLPELSEVCVQSRTNHQGRDLPISREEADRFISDLSKWLEQGHAMYNKWIGGGVAKETARAFLGVPLMTRFYMTGNLRNWAHFQGLRLDSHAQYEVRLIAQQADMILTGLWPISYRALMRQENIS